MVVAIPVFDLVRVTDGVKVGETVDVKVNGLVVAIAVRERVRVAELDWVNVFGNDVGIGERDAQLVVVIDTGGDAVIL